MALYEGANGKLYYNFAQGLKALMHGSERDRNEEYEIEIVGCHFVGDTEYYDVKRDGVQLPQPLSANRIKYLLSRYGVKTLAIGERQELPLTVEEVKRFYEYQEQLREREQNKAREITEYVSLKMAANALISQIGYAKAFGRDEEAAALTAQREELERRANAVLKVHGINPADVAEPAPCKKCDGKGYYYKTICGCAIPHTQEIKEFCARERLRLKRLTGG